REHARRGARLRRAPAGDLDRRRDPRPARPAAGRQRPLGGARLVRRHHRRRLRRRDVHLSPQDRLRQSVAMLTISRLAAYAGVTVRAVRHYHQIGLLPEPERTYSGYRTYDAAAVV